MFVNISQRAIKPQTKYLHPKKYQRQFSLHTMYMYCVFFILEVG